MSSLMTIIILKTIFFIMQSLKIFLKYIWISLSDLFTEMFGRFTPKWQPWLRERHLQSIKYQFRRMCCVRTIKRDRSGIKTLSRPTVTRVVIFRTDGKEGMSFGYVLEGRIASMPGLVLALPCSNSHRTRPEGQWWISGVRRWIRRRIWDRICSYFHWSLL